MTQHPLLYIYIAKTSDTALILCKYPSKSYQLIQWNIKDDTFIQGQWLMKGKVKPLSSKISEDGTYFAYRLNSYEGEIWPRVYDVVSKSPYFTAISIQSIDNNEPVINKGTLPKNLVWLDLSITDGQSYVLSDSSKILVNMGCILKNDKVILDVTKNLFLDIKAPYSRV